MIGIRWWNHRGKVCEPRFRHEIDALHFAEGLDCEGLAHERCIAGVSDYRGADSSGPDGLARAALIR